MYASVLLLIKKGRKASVDVDTAKRWVEDMICENLIGGVKMTLIRKRRLTCY